MNPSILIAAAFSTVAFTATSPNVARDIKARANGQCYWQKCLAAKAKGHVVGCLQGEKYHARAQVYCYDWLSHKLFKAYCCKN
ncbi:Protein of unknown function [Pyronema omphalodes CBS 100304]|uniref:Uncharacterized protein n=1 Tax=Pyronema omphalodes (strain CBS 100304) TaxID=1076935 RepID=U4KU98_PYROM|nr:Protein of unknown function [Pyronema omphalodes CBS 100304]